MIHKQVETLKSIFGTPSPPETTKIYKAKIQNANLYSPIFGQQLYYALVKFSFFGKWKKLKWTFFDEQPGKGLTRCRAVTSPWAAPMTKQSCEDLLNDFIDHKGAGVTIW